MLGKAIAITLLAAAILTAAAPGVASSVEIRPGAQLANGCTMGWVFRDANGTFYVSTAGHCATLGGRESVAGLGEFGTVVVQEAAGLGADFALIQVDAADQGLVNPTMLHFGGPTGAAMADVPGAAYAFYGWGVDTSGSDATRARVDPELAPPVDFLSWAGHVSSGDSGSPVMSVTGLAMGIATHSLAEPIAGGVAAHAAFGTPLRTMLGVAVTHGYVLQLVPGGPVDDAAILGAIPST